MRPRRRKTPRRSRRTLRSRRSSTDCKPALNKSDERRSPLYPKPPEPFYLVLSLFVVQGSAVGRSFDLPGEIVTIGRSPANHVVLEDTHVSGEHARVVQSDGHVVLTDLRSTNGTTLVRRGERTRLTGEQSSIELETDDVIELGTGDTITAVRVTITEDADTARVVSMRSLDDLEPAVKIIEQDPGALSALYAAQKRIGVATDLDRVLVEVADAAL